MAIRVRKLAKELDRSPTEVLGLLHAIGFEKYRSAEDQVPDPTVQHVRDAIRSGVRPLSVVLHESTRHAEPVRPQVGRGDVMATLVPGVVPVGGAARPVPRPVVAVPVRTRPTPPTADPEPARVLQADHQAAAAAWAVERSALAAEGEALRSRLADRPELPTLSSVLEAVGGGFPSEQQWALLLPYLHVHDAPLVAALLARPPAPARLVAPEREVARVGERLMLLGLRRLVIIGGTPSLLKLLRESFDPRIDLRLRGADRPRQRGDAEQDVTRSDAVVLWGVSVEPAAIPVYRTSRAVVIEVVDPGLPAFLAEVNRRLDEI